MPQSGYILNPKQGKFGVYIDTAYHAPILERNKIKICCI